MEKEEREMEGNGKVVLMIGGSGGWIERGRMRNMIVLDNKRGRSEIGNNKEGIKERIEGKEGGKEEGEGGIKKKRDEKMRNREDLKKRKRNMVGGKGKRIRMEIEER